MTFINNFSKYCYSYLLKTKDEVFNKFKVFKTDVENQIEKKIKILRSDHGGEYTSNEFAMFCEEHSIIHEISAPYSSQSNGITEWKNRTLLDMVNFMIISSGVLKNLWGEALFTSTIILNKISSNNKKKTP